jgi:hypothetical protein
MDFLGMKQAEDEIGDGGLGMIASDGGDFGQGSLLNEGENVDPAIEKGNGDLGTGRKGTKAGKESGLAFGDGVRRIKERKRKTSKGETADDQDWHNSTPRPTSRRGVPSKALSEHNPGRSAAKAMDTLTSRKTRATTKADAELLQAEHYLLFAQDGKENVDTGGQPSTIPETPKKRPDIVPSSQSPESVPLSSRKRPYLPRQASEGSPLRERSANVTPIVCSTVRHEE